MMNRRSFFRKVGGFVAGCYLGLGLKPKVEEFIYPPPKVFTYKEVPSYPIASWYDFLMAEDKDKYLNELKQQIKNYNDKRAITS